MIDKLNDENVEQFAIFSLRNPMSLSEDDFSEVMQRFKNIKKLLLKYEKSQILRERLILNHTIILFNTFKTEECKLLLAYFIGESHYRYLRPFLVYQGYMKEQDLRKEDLDPHIIERIRAI